MDQDHYDEDFLSLLQITGFHSQPPHQQLELGLVSLIHFNQKNHLEEEGKLHYYNNFRLGKKHIKKILETGDIFVNRLENYYRGFDIINTTNMTRVQS